MKKTFIKKILSAITVIIIILSVFTFAGCGAAKQAADTAGEVVTDIADGASKAVSDMENNTDGDVKDDDGFINE